MSFMLPYKFHAVHWRHSTAAAIFSTSGSWRSTSSRRDISRSWEHESLVPGKGCGATNVQTMRLPTQVKYKIEGGRKILGTSVCSVEDNTIQMQQGDSLQTNCQMLTARQKIRGKRLPAYRMSNGTRPRKSLNFATLPAMAPMAEKIWRQA